MNVGTGAPDDATGSLEEQEREAEAHKCYGKKSSKQNRPRRVEPKEHEQAVRGQYQQRKQAKQPPKEAAHDDLECW